MEPKLLKTESDYKEAIKELEKIGDNPSFDESPNLIIRFELLSKLIELYEKEHFSIQKGDPIEIIKLKMELLGLKNKDLIPSIGSKGIVSEVLNKKRGLSKNMIRNLSQLLNIDQAILNNESQTNEMSEKAKTVLRKSFIQKTTFNYLSVELFKYASIYQRKVAERGMLFNLCSK